MPTPTCTAYITRIESFGFFEADEYYDERTESRGEEQLAMFTGTFDEVAAQVAAAVPAGLVWASNPNYNEVTAPLPDMGPAFRMQVAVYLNIGDFDLPEIEEMNTPVRVVAAALLAA